jgi:hypothetical protein
VFKNGPGDSQLETCTAWSQIYPAISLSMQNRAISSKLPSVAVGKTGAALSKLPLGFLGYLLNNPQMITILIYNDFTLAISHPLKRQPPATHVRQHPYVGK